MSSRSPSLWGTRGAEVAESSPYRPTRAHLGRIVRPGQGHIPLNLRVELVRRYANNGGLAHDLHLALRQISLQIGKRPGLRTSSPRVKINAIEDRLEPAHVTEILKAYVDGAHSPDLAKQFGVSKGAVVRMLRSHGVAVRQQPMTDEDVAEAISLYVHGWSLARVGRHFGREHTVIRNALVDAGVPRRDTHGRVR